MLQVTALYAGVLGLYFLWLARLVIAARGRHGISLGTDHVEVLRAVRAIRAGDEVTHDYSTHLGADDVWTMRCDCGERACRGRIGRFDRLPARTLARYRRLGMIPGFVEATASG